MKFSRLLIIALMFAVATPTVAIVVAPVTAEARSMSGGRLFRPSTPTYRAPIQQRQPGMNQQQTNPYQRGGFGRSLFGGMLGGAMGALLFGSLFGMGGHGFGLLPMVILAVVGYVVYRTFSRNRPVLQRQATGAPFGGAPTGFTDFDIGSGAQPPPVPPVSSVEDGLAEIRRHDPGFDDRYFLQVASDVFFQIQAGWAGRDLSTYRHLLADQLAAEYQRHFEEMRAAGRINRLENIAVRSVEIAAAGSRDGIDYVTVLFQANLLDYTVDERTGDIVEGSRTRPVKFAEHWTWARPVKTEQWRLEGIDVVDEQTL